MATYKKTFYYFRCDECGTESLKYETSEESARQSVLDLGWQLNGCGTDFCPNCISTRGNK